MKAEIENLKSVDLLDMCKEMGLSDAEQHIVLIHSDFGSPTRNDCYIKAGFYNNARDYTSSDEEHSALFFKVEDYIEEKFKSVDLFWICW